MSKTIIETARSGFLFPVDVGLFADDPIMARLPFGDIDTISETRFKRKELMLLSWNSKLPAADMVPSDSEPPVRLEYSIDMGPWKQLYMEDDDGQNDQD